MSSTLFKNLVIYRFTQPFTLSANELEEKLREKPFRSCGSQDVSTYGWVPSLGPKSKALVYENGHALLICAGQEERILPPQVIRDAVQARVERLEAEQDRTVFSKEKAAIRDDVIMELLPKAFTKQTHTLAYIDKNDGWLVVNASSFKQAEMLTSCLRECLGSLPVINTPLKELPGFVLTRWLTHRKLPEGFSLGYACQLKEPGDEGGTIIARNEGLDTEAMEQHLASGKQVKRLAINWRDAFQLQIHDDLRMTQIKYYPEFKEELDDMELDTEQQQREADFYLMTAYYRRFLEELVKAMGGLSE